jgi:hypothetical protein
MDKMDKVDKKEDLDSAVLVEMEDSDLLQVTEAAEAVGEEVVATMTVKLSHKISFFKQNWKNEKQSLLNRICKSDLQRRQIN